MMNFGNSLEEFITDFKKRVIAEAYWTYPKEYRKSNEYTDKDIDEKFQQALNSSYAKQSILNVIEEYYETIREYEEILGY